jgi:hypothetical protein
MTRQFITYDGGFRSTNRRRVGRIGDEAQGERIAESGSGRKHCELRAYPGGLYGCVGNGSLCAT